MVAQHVYPLVNLLDCLESIKMYLNESGENKERLDRQFVADMQESLFTDHKSKR